MVRTMFNELLFFKKLGVNIKNLRFERGLSRSEVAQLSGLRNNFLKRIENGKALKLKPFHLLILASVFELKLSEFFNGI